jgi:hypothetical protein
MNVLRRRANQNVVRIWQSVPLLCRRVKISKRALVQLKRYSSAVARLQKDFLEAFKFLNGPGNRRVLFAYIELSNFSSGTIARIGNRKADSYKVVVLTVVILKLGFQEAVLLAVVLLLNRLDIQIHVSERRVRQSEPERELGLDTVSFVAPVADKYSFTVFYLRRIPI